MVYGPIAAMLVELFPTRIRYTAMSLPYHIGNGWFGGFLPITAFAIVAATGVTLGQVQATANTLVQSTVPDSLRGRVMSVYMMVFVGFFPIGSLIAGTVAENFGVPAGAAFGGTIALAYGLFLLWRVPQIRRLR